MKRVLLVVSSYQPVLSASMQRARMMAWHLREYGWEFEILAPSASLQPQTWIDGEAGRFFAPEAPVTEAGEMKFANLLRRAGVRGLSWQALLPIHAAGSDLLRKKHFDLVFFSTTAFNLFCLGRLWRNRFHVPYVLDFQDPWFRTDGAVRTTRHVWKARIGNVLSKFMEGYAVNGASGLVAVSPHYLQTLEQRYPRALAFRKGVAATIPFGGMRADFVEMPGQDPQEEKLFTIGYVGAGGVLMERSFDHLCRAFGRLRKAHPDLIAQFRIRLAGTDSGWKEGDRKLLKEKADAAGIGDLVTEDPSIISYSKAAAVAAASDGLLVLGIEEPAYMASKLFAYASMEKPLLASIDPASQMNDYFRQYPELGTVVHFGQTPETEIAGDARILDFLHQVRDGRPQIRTRLMDEFSASGMTRKLADLFDRCVRV